MYTGMGAVTAAEYALLPPCWDKQFQDCLGERNMAFPNCAEIHAIYDRSDEDWNLMEDAVDSMPYCDGTACCYDNDDVGCLQDTSLPPIEGPSFESKLVWSGVGAVAGIILTGIVALAIS
jgi:hypothetical protein